MFNIKHNECVGFESRWTVKKSRVSTVGSTQVTDFSTKEIGTNTSDKIEIEVQTEILDNACKDNVDEEKLANWLKQIYPAVAKELDDASNSKAFKGYRLASDRHEAFSKIAQNVTVITDNHSKNYGCRVSALSWNSTGKTLAVSCNHTHRFWCYHEGFVAIYPLTREDLLPEAPKIKLATETCVMALNFHPSSPSILAVGLYSGQIILYNIQREEEVNIVEIMGHQEGVTQLSWIADLNSAKKYVLASSGLDGVLKIWNYEPTTLNLTIREKYKIKPPLLARLPRTEIDPNEAEKKPFRGIVCFDFSHHIPDKFVVGAEGGLIVECSLLGASVLKGGSEDVPVLDPVFKYYEPHKGEVISTKFSPNRKEMFLTFGSDGEIRIYLLNQEEPAQIIFIRTPLSSVNWVPYEEKLIAGCGNNGIVEVYHVVKEMAIKNTVKEKIVPQILTQMEINRTKINLVVVGSEKGILQLWKVPWALLTSSV